MIHTVVKATYLLLTSSIWQFSDGILSIFLGGFPSAKLEKITFDT